jgi:hypothetical protein
MKTTRVGLACLVACLAGCTPPRPYAYQQRLTSALVQHTLRRYLDEHSLDPHRSVLVLLTHKTRTGPVVYVTYSIMPLDSTGAQPAHWALYARHLVLVYEGIDGVEPAAPALLREEINAVLAARRITLPGTTGVFEPRAVRAQERNGQET